MFFFHCWEKNTVLHSAAYSSSNRGGHQGQIPQRHKWKGVGGGEGEGTEGGDRKGEGSKVREGRERGRKGKEKKKKRNSVLAANSFWILLLLYCLTSETFSSPERPLMSWIWESSLINGWFLCLTALSPVKTPPPLTLSLSLPFSPSLALSSHLLWYVTHFIIIPKTPEEAALPGSVFPTTISHTEYSVSFYILFLCSWLAEWCFRSWLPWTALIKAA